MTSTTGEIGELKRYWADINSRVDTALRKTLDTIRMPEPIREAIEYVLFPGGKRFRPFLMLSTADAIRGLLQLDMTGEEVMERMMPLAVAVELIHNYSLVHDDLPAMDNDTYRRGKLTAHKVYGEGKAVLLGDEMLTLAFEVLTVSALRERSFHPEDVLKVISLFARKAGARYLIGGQWYDLDLNYAKSLDEVNPDRIRFLGKVNFMKTGGLITLCVQVPAVLLRAPFKICYYLTGYAVALGELFQVTDDLLDSDGYVKLIGVDGAEVMADKLARKAMANLDKLATAYTSYPLRYLYELVKFIRYRTV